MGRAWGMDSGRVALDKSEVSVKGGIPLPSSGWESNLPFWECRQLIPGNLLDLLYE
jgi:hypothetical protein